MSIPRTTAQAANGAASLPRLVAADGSLEAVKWLALVEFWWPALALGLAVWLYCRRPSWTAIALAVAAFGGLWYVNGNPWALAAVPIALGASGADLRVPRLRWMFYAYYPAHLVALLLIRIPMSKAGYLFF